MDNPIGVKVVRILIVEDKVDDINALKKHIKNIGLACHVSVADTFEKFQDVLSIHNFDIILSGYSMVGFNGLDVFSHASEVSNSSDFIFVTGAIHDEELASQTILSRATAYVLKNNLLSLEPTLQYYIERRIHAYSELQMCISFNSLLIKIKKVIEDARRENQQHINCYRQMKKMISNG